MPLDINGYNDTFRKFAKFAQDEYDAGRHKSIAAAGVKVLKNRNILAVSTAENDEVHKWLRRGAQFSVNDRTRDLFRKSVIDMFGGAAKIPDSVKEAMLLEDYDEGKPLTARRILIVKRAIDACGIPRQRAEEQRLTSFEDPENKAAMLAKGYSTAELPRLARAAHFWAKLNQCAEFEALEEITKPGSKANRLMQYGGRFLESAESFANGLRLLDAYEPWFAQTKATLEAVGRNYGEGMTKTVLNASQPFFHPTARRGMEKFIFEEIACNPAFDLAETDPEKLFGMENNTATGFFGRGFGNSFSQTVANIPPARRGAFYAAVQTAFPLLADPATARMPAWQRLERGIDAISHLDRGIVIGRIMKNLDQLQTLFATGKLTARNLVKACFPETRWNTLASVNAFIKQTQLDVRGDVANDIPSKYPEELSGPIMTMLEETGCSVKEAVAAARGGRRPARPKYVAAGTLPIEAFDGTTNVARTQFEGDVCRPAGYTLIGQGQELLSADGGFRFAFPDGSSYTTNNSAAGRANIRTVADKAEALCGAVHREQASSVLMLLSQSGLGNLLGGLVGHGIASSEHSAVDYTLTKNERTGDVTIHYASPKELPFRFKWTAKVDVYGNVTSTPMKFERPVENLGAGAAKKLVDASARKLGVDLTGAQKREAVRLLRQHGTNMYAKNAQLFARFLVRLVTRTRNLGAAAKAAMAAETAGSIRGWRDFGFGDSGLAPFADAAKDYANSVIRDHMRPGNAGKFADNIHSTLLADADRAIYILNGTTYDRKPAGELVPALKALVPDPKKQKAISTWINQLCMNTIVSPSNHVPYPTGVAAHELPGFGALANRSLLTGTFENPVLETVGHGIVHDLKLSPDGRTATITQTISTDLAAPGSNMQRKIGFGRATFTQRLVIDLEPEIPTVTEYQLSQTIA